nr:winged helix-turn-helix domain-containing protein [Streptomyces sp. SID5785]
MRVFFTERDLSRVQVLGPDPLWETVLGLHQLTSAGEPAFAAWRRQALEAVAEQKLQAAVRLLHELAPHDARHFPDFITPFAGAQGLRPGLAALRSTPTSQIAKELALTATTRPLPAWCRSLAAGNRRLLGQTADALEAVFEGVVAPAWDVVSCHIQDERAHAGARRDPAGLPSVFRWSPPVLHADFPFAHDIHLAGRGLTLIPSYFCHRTPVALIDQDLPPVLVYPIDHDPLWTLSGTHRRTEPVALGALLGRTRARVLTALGRPATTTEVAGRLGVAVSSASEHVKVLRDTGLATSRRTGGAVVHALTPLGEALLAGELPDR